MVEPKVSSLKDYKLTSLKLDGLRKKWGRHKLLISGINKVFHTDAIDSKGVIKRKLGKILCQKILEISMKWKNSEENIIY